MSLVRPAKLRRGADILFQPDRIEAALWRNYREQPEPELRQKLFERYRRFAERLAAAQFHARAAGNFDRADIQQLAYEALLHAIDRFDHRRGVPFEAYARIRIKGHVSSGLIHASEASAQFHSRRRMERERLRSLADEMDPGGADPLAELSSLATSLAIGLMLEDSYATIIETVPDPGPSAYETLEWTELVRTVHEAIEALPEREAFVLREHYRGGVSFQQIANLMGVTKGRVSQIHRAGLQKLRSLLAKRL